MKVNRKHTIIIIITYALLIGISSMNFLFSEEAAKTKSPVFKLSFIERLRYEGWDNAVSLNNKIADTRSYTRQRTSIMAQWIPDSDIELAIKFTNEFRYNFNPKDQTLKMHEIFFDYLYFKWKNIGKTPLSITVGRQDMLFGEGFVIADGTPLDGSRSYYFNAVRFDYTLDNSNQLTAFVNYEPATDNILPIIHSSTIPDQALVDRPEMGAGIYYTGKFNKTVIEGYGIHKYEKITDFFPVKNNTETLGVRVTQSFTPAWSLTAEGAFQFGKVGDNKRKAFGGYAHLDYKFEKTVPFLKTATLGGVYLSGDNPSTDTYEGWNPVFSRWPKWSESYIYTLIRETGVANWTNLSTVYLSLLMPVVDTMTFRLTWHHLMANKFVPGFTMAGTGKTRGDLIIGKLEFILNKHTTGHVIWEHLNPGNYYFEGANGYNWLRFELMFRF